MNAEWQSLVQAAESESARLMGEGDGVAAAAALAEKAQLLAGVRQYEKAIAALGECAALAQAANAPGPRAEYLHAQGLLLARVPGREVEAKEAFRTSTALARLSGDVALEVRGLQRRAELDLNRKDVAGAVARLDLALERATDGGLAEVRVTVLRTRAVYLQAQGRLSAALADLDAAVDAAAALPDRDEHLLLQLRLERRVLTDLVAGGQRKDTFEEIRDAAMAAGAADVALDVRVQTAGERLRDADYAGGLAEAEAAKRLALETNDAYRYTLACMLLAEAHERLGDLASVISVLLGCKITLEQQVSLEAGQAVKGILQSLETRWGAEVVQGALAEHRRRLQAAPAGHA